MIPHGTPAGFAAGCRDEKTCPALAEHGMACLHAHVRSITDTRYMRLAADGHPPAEIARRLHFTITPITTPTPPQAPAEEIIMPKRTIHTPADGTNDAVRAWARENGLHVGDRGRIPQLIRDAYTAGDPTIALPDHVEEPPTEATEDATIEVDFDFNEIAMREPDPEEPRLTETTIYAEADDHHPVTPSAPENELRADDLIDAVRSASSEGIELASATIRLDVEMGEVIVSDRQLLEERTIADWLTIRDDLAATVAANGVAIGLYEGRNIAEALLVAGWQKP